MHLIRGLSDTPIGRALLAYFFGLSRWTLASIMFAVSLLPALLALLDGAFTLVAPASFPASIAGAAIINMAGREARTKAARWRDVLSHPVTYLAAAVFWCGLLLLSTLLFLELPVIVLCVVCVLVLPLLMIGVFALCVPSLLDSEGVQLWRNALVLAVHYPIVALGLLALMAVGAWAIWLTRGALILVVPPLWSLIAAFTTQDRIDAVRESASRNEAHPNR